METVQQRTTPGNSLPTARTSRAAEAPERPSASEASGTAAWTVEIHYDRHGAFHMERDEQLAVERTQDDALPNVLRLYSWSPSALSIGFQQKLESVDQEACRERGIDVVRRPTGGRAVLHARELTYAVIMRAAPGQGIYEMHNLIVTSLLASLGGLGTEAERLAVTGRTTAKNFQQIYLAGTLTNAACFASSARHEVTFEGRKVIGSAQRRFGAVALQHGSILLTEDHLELPELLRLSAEERTAMHRLLRQETATLSDVFGRPIRPEEAGEQIRSCFVEHLTQHHQAARSLDAGRPQQIIL